MNSSCCAAQQALNRFGCESFTCLAAATIALTTGSGPRRPNAARALWKESYIDRNCRSGRDVASRKTHYKTQAPLFLVGPVRQAARLDAAIARHERAWPIASR